MSNIEKIQKMVKGIYNRPIQTGYEGKTVQQRKEGEEWTDARGRSWKMEDGKRKQITKVPPRGFDKCNDCSKLILKTIDQDTYNRMQRGYHCQIDFECVLKEKGEWEDWVKDQEKKRWETVVGEYEAEMELVEDSETLKFDKKVANAIAKESHR